MYFQFNGIYFQLMFLLNIKEIYWEERISIETNLTSILLNLLSIDFLLSQEQNAPKVFFAQ